IGVGVCAIWKPKEARGVTHTSTIPRANVQAELHGPSTTSVSPLAAMTRYFSTYLPRRPPSSLLAVTHAGGYAPHPARPITWAGLASTRNAQTQPDRRRESTITHV